MSFYISVSLSIFQYFCISISSVCLSIHLTMYLSISLFMVKPDCYSLEIFVNLSVFSICRVRLLFNICFYVGFRHLKVPLETYNYQEALFCINNFHHIEFEPQRFF